MFQFRAVREPARILREEKLAGLAEEWKREMDYIIIDCSPVAVSVDAEVWVSVADSVLLVVREDWADVRVINDAVGYDQPERDGLYRVCAECIPQGMVPACGAAGVFLRPCVPEPGYAGRGADRVERGAYCP